MSSKKRSFGKVFKIYPRKQGWQILAPKMFPTFRPLDYIVMWLIHVHSGFKGFSGLSYC